MAIAYARKSREWEEMSARVVAHAQEPKRDGRFSR
jgi:hypothetical protein